MPSEKVYEIQPSYAMAAPLLLVTALLNVMLIFPVAIQAKEMMSQGLLEMRPAPDASKGRRFCVTYFPNVHNLTLNRKTAVSHKLTNLTSWDGCSEPTPKPMPDTDQRWVFLNQSAEVNCSLDERVARLQKLQAAGIIIQVNEPYLAMANNQSASPIPVTFISWRDVPEILNITSGEGIQYAIPQEKLFNYGLIIIWFMANLTVMLGGIWSATVKYELHIQEEQTRRSAPVGSTTVTLQASDGEASSMPVTVISAIFAIALIVTFLLLSYFFSQVMYYVVLVLFFTGSVSGLYTCLNAINARLPCNCDLGIAPSVRSSCCSCRLRVSQLLLFAVSLAVAVVWLVYRNDNTWGWVLQDLLGVAFSLSLIRTCRLPNMRIMTFFVVGLLIYDIFFVFITPLLTTDGKSIMVEVATGGGDNVLPMVLKVPYIIHAAYPECQPADSFSLLGYGDVIVPGFIVAYCAAIDKIYIGRHVYFATSATGYGLGLIVTFVALYAMERAQPALLYLVPMVLLPVVAVALVRRQFLLLWHGEKQSGSGDLLREQPDYNTVNSLEE